MTSIYLLRLPAVVDRCARSRSALYRDIAAGLFTPPIHLGSRSSAWPAHEVDALLRAQIAGVPADELRALVLRLTAERIQTRDSSEAA